MYVSFFYRVKIYFDRNLIGFWGFVFCRDIFDYLIWEDISVFRLLGGKVIIRKL